MNQIERTVSLVINDMQDVIEYSIKPCVESRQGLDARVISTMIHGWILALSGILPEESTCEDEHIN